MKMRLCHMCDSEMIKGFDVKVENVPMRERL